MDEDKSDAYIKPPDVMQGAFLIHRKAKKTYYDAKFMYDNQKFTSSIVHAITAIEESQKSIELAIMMRKNQAITREIWGKMMTHKYKLINTKKFSLQTLENQSLSNIEKYLKKLLPRTQEFNTNQLKEILRKRIYIYPYFQKIKEKCQYLDWDEKTNSWDNFDNLDNNKQQDIAYYFLVTNALELNCCQLCIEYSINVIRQKGLKEFAYNTDPKKTILSYPEYRDPNDFDVVRKPDISIFDLEQNRYVRGYNMIKKFADIQGSINKLHQAYHSDLFVNVLKLLNKQPDSIMYPHPIIRAAMITLSTLEEKYEENPSDFDTKKNIVGGSGDAEETSNGEPTMVALCMASCEKGIYVLEKFSINGDEYISTHEIIENILKTEEVIEKHKGKTMPLDAVHEAYGKIGIKLKKLKDSNIVDAIIEAQKIINENRITGLSDTIRQGVLEATEINWNKLEPNVRCFIGATYLAKIEQGAMSLTGFYNPIEKFRVRNMIYHTLKLNEEFKIYK